MIRIPLAEWIAKGARATHRGHEVFYRDEGEGDALVLLHGFPTASWDWNAVWPALVARFRVIAPDLLGFGMSAKPQGYAYSLDDQATLVESLLAARGVGRVHVLAHDYGDSVAQELLARFNRRDAGLALRSVCFLNGGLFPETHRPRVVQRLLISPLGPALARLMTERSFGQSLSAVFAPGTQPTDEELRAYWQLVQTRDGMRVFPYIIRYMRERRAQRARWVGALQEAKIPLRLINGALDPVSGRHMAQRYREVVPRADVVMLDRVGHYPQVEDPDGVLKAYFDFIDR